MKRRFLLTTMLSVLMVPLLAAQDFCLPCGQEYRIVCKTVYEEQPVTTRRLVYETVVETRQAVSYRPVWETSMRERRYTVTKPVLETSSREERRTVMRPVWEVRYRDESYQQTRYVTETSSREERRTVQKPITETRTRQERRVVQRPVVETVMQDRTETVYRPVTNVFQRTVDQGQFVDQCQHVPGRITHRLQWKNSQCTRDPATGQSGVLRSGFYWVPKQSPGSYQTNRVYVPKIVVQQKTQSSYVPQQVTRKVAVDVTRMESEVQVRDVSYQVVRMQPEEQVRTVPVTVQRPVTETIPRFVREYRCQYVPEEQVRTVPVKTYKYVTEERLEQIPVRKCKMVAEYRNVEVPRTECHWVTETSTRTIARKVWVKIPIDSCPVSCGSDCGGFDGGCPGGGCSVSSVPGWDTALAMNTTLASTVTRPPSSHAVKKTETSGAENRSPQPAEAEGSETNHEPGKDTQDGDEPSGAAREAGSPPKGSPPILEGSSNA